jgi:polyisoprenoid-binding protein YceI
MSRRPSAASIVAMSTQLLTNTSATGRWTVEPGNVTCRFTVTNLFVKTVHGRFGDVTATVRADDAGGLEVDACVAAESIDTGIAKRDRHLRSRDFFAADDHPYLTFRSTRCEHGPDGMTLHGDLSIRGVARPVALAAEVEHMPDGRMRVRATGEIDRYEHGIGFGPRAMAGRRVALSISGVARPA